MSKQTIFLLRDSNSQKDNTRDFQILFSKIARDLNVEDKIQIIRAADLGIYDKGYIVKDLTNNIIYTNVSEEDISTL